MYIYHALINALSTHMIHVNLNMIFYTHVEHSPTKTIYIKYYTKRKKCATHAHTHTHTHSDCSRNWVLISVRMEILWEEEGFQFGFKRWQGWAVSHRYLIHLCGCLLSKKTLTTQSFSIILTAQPVLCTHHLAVNLYSASMDYFAFRHFFFHHEYQLAFIMFIFENGNKNSCCLNICSRAHFTSFFFFSFSSCLFWFVVCTCCSQEFSVTLK